jgi:type III pantothenate kinase
MIRGMDINLLVLNVGNTRVGIGVFVAGELAYSTRIDLANQGDLAGRLSEAWSRLIGKEQAAVAGASVNPDADQALNAAVQHACGRPVEWVGKHLDLPIKVTTEHPEETGVDRIVTMAAAYEQREHSCVVVDAGTAITIDCCNDAGEFLGGAIAPGVAMSLDALHQRTAKLPRVTLAVPAESIARSTDEAIRHGVFHGIRGMVKEIVENYASEMGNWPEIIATGGDAALLFDGWELVHAVAPDLALYGIALAYANHYIKHAT